MDSKLFSLQYLLILCFVVMLEKAHGYVMVQRMKIFPVMHSEDAEVLYYAQ